MRHSGRLIARDRDVVAVRTPDIDALGLGRGLDLCCPSRHLHQYRVKEAIMHHGVAAACQSGGQQLRIAVDPGGNGTQPFRTVVARIHRGHHSQ